MDKLNFTKEEIEHLANACELYANLFLHHKNKLLKISKIEDEEQMSIVFYKILQHISATNKSFDERLSLSINKMDNKEDLKV